MESILIAKYGSGSIMLWGTSVLYLIDEIMRKKTECVQTPIYTENSVHILSASHILFVFHLLFVLFSKLRGSSLVIVYKYV